MEVLCRSMCWPHQLKFNTAFAVGPWPAMQGSGSAWAEALQSLPWVQVWLHLAAA